MSNTATLEPIRVELPKGGQYKADRNADGTWNVRDVLCFVEYGKWDRAWLENAVSKAKAERDRGGYIGPLHVRHHDVFNTASAVEAKAVEAAGLFAPSRVAEIDFEGQRKAAAYADWLKIPDPIFQRMKSVQLPYRSVEILRGSETLDSCALLDHEPPRFRFPLTTIGSEQFAADRAESSIFFFRASGEQFMSLPDKDPSGAAQGAPANATQGGQPAGQAPAAAPAPGIDVNALATAIANALAPSIAQSVNGAMVAANAGKVKPEAGDPAPTDGVNPAEQSDKSKVGSEEPALAAFKAAAATQHKALADRVAASEKFAAALVAEKATEKAIRAATIRLEKVGQKVDETYEGELRAKAEKGLGVLEEHVATREKFSAAEPPVWGGEPVKRQKAPAELEAFRAQGPEAFAAATEASAEYFRMPAVMRESLPLADFLKYSAKPAAGVAINGASNGGGN